MSSSPPSFRSRPKLSDSAAVAVAPNSRWRTAVLRGIAAAHIVAGAFDLLRVASNFALGLSYSGGPLGFTGAGTTYLARFIDGPILMLPREYAAFWPRSEWIVRQAQTMGSFLGIIMAAHLAVAMLAREAAQVSSITHAQPASRRLRTSRGHRVHPEPRPVRTDGRGPHRTAAGVSGARSAR